MATVKGDVHDIGKNIVGVVLQCNGYEVIDMGVMQSCAAILERAKLEGVDVIGLSGLITPSLEEMRFVASEMERLGFTIPLLIGGATTSKAHTAIKLESAYSGPVVHVHDASRAVGVTSALLNDARRDAYVAEVRAEYEAIRVARADAGKGKKMLTIDQARANKATIDLTVPVPVPTFLGARTFDQWPLDDLARYIDWTPFFQTWELAGHYPNILQDPVVGAAARSLFADAQELLHRIVRDKLFTAKAAVGFWPATAEGETITLFTDGALDTVAATLPLQRQLFAKSAGRANRSLADYVAPSGSGLTDYVGLFAVTTGHGVNELVAEFEREHDDYNSILAKALADRLAEAFAERLHEHVRSTLWGYAPNEALENAALVHEQYQGIRPAPGYPACPDHSLKDTLFALLDAPGRAGMSLTESWSMLPASSVSGLYFWRPEAAYFGVGLQPE